MSNFYGQYPIEGGGGGSGVSSLDGLTGALTLVAGTGITITDNSPSPGSITIAATGGSGGITSINADTTAAQLLSVGTAGTDFHITDAGGGSHVFNLPTASAANRGALSSADWTTFNNKQNALTFGNLTDVGTDGIIITGGTGAVIGPGTSLAQHVADSTHNGYLSSVDWNTFNNKQSALTFGNLTDVGTDGITVTNGTGAVIGTGTSLSQHVADSTHNGYLSSTDWTTFNNKLSSVPQSNIARVDKSGNNGTAVVGDFAKPFLTVDAAIAAITTAAYGNLFIIQIGEGTFSVTAALKPYIFFVGQTEEVIVGSLIGFLDLSTTPGTILDFGASNISLSAAWNTSATRQSAGFFNLIATSSVAQTIDFSSAPTASFLFVNSLLSFNAGFNLIGNTTENFSAPCTEFEFSNSTINGDVSFTRGVCVFNKSFLNGAANFNGDPLDVVNTIVFIFHSNLGGSLDIQGTGSTAFIEVENIITLVGSTTTVNGSHAFYVATIDAIPNSSNISVTGGATFIRGTDAFALGYTPAVPGNWSPTVPNNVAQALDIIAAAAGAGGANVTLSNLTTTAINADLIFGVTAGNHQVKSGDTTGVNSDPLTITTGSTDNNTSGVLTLTTGIGTTNGGSGNAVLSTGTALYSSTSGDIDIFSGNPTDGNSGAINLLTGTPSGVGTPGPITIATGSNSVNSNFPNNGVTIASGDDVATRNSGDILLKIGTSTATRGQIVFQDGTEGTSGYVWTSTDTTGRGAWMPGGSGGANTALSNLTATAINQSLTPDTDNVYSIGNAGSLAWAQIASYIYYGGAGTSLIDMTAPNIQLVTTVPAGELEVFNFLSLDLKGQGENADSTSLRFYDNTVSPTNYMGFRAPDTLSGVTDFILPDGDGSAGQTMSTDGAGNLYWNLKNGTGTITALSATATITDASITTSSKVFVVITQNDATAVLKNVVPGSGSAVLNLTVAATSNTTFAYFIMN